MGALQSISVTSRGALSLDALPSPRARDPKPPLRSAYVQPRRR